VRRGVCSDAFPRYSEFIQQARDQRRRIQCAIGPRLEEAGAFARRANRAARLRPGFQQHDTHSTLLKIPCACKSGYPAADDDHIRVEPIAH